MRLIVEVVNFPDQEPVDGAELLQGLKESVIDRLELEGFPFGSGYGVWAFYDD